MKKLSIILMPTYYCNAKCDYCFISYKNQKYTIEIVNKIFNSINDFLEIEEITNIDFYWQGGEVMTMGTDFF
jgi:sulfatase maturation enzyme AslB (radical SAM superfamily)